MPIPMTKMTERMLRPCEPSTAGAQTSRARPASDQAQVDLYGLSATRSAYEVL